MGRILYLFMTCKIVGPPKLKCHKTQPKAWDAVTFGTAKNTSRTRPEVKHVQLILHLYVHDYNSLYTWSFRLHTPQIRCNIYICIANIFHWYIWLYIQPCKSRWNWSCHTSGPSSSLVAHRQSLLASVITTDK